MITDTDQKEEARKALRNKQARIRDHAKAKEEMVKRNYTQNNVVRVLRLQAEGRTPMQISLLLKINLSIVLDIIKFNNEAKNA